MVTVKLELETNTGAPKVIAQKKKLILFSQILYPSLHGIHVKTTLYLHVSIPSKEVFIRKLK